jgi:hypothetical protein
VIPKIARPKNLQPDRPTRSRTRENIQKMLYLFPEDRAVIEAMKAILTAWGIKANDSLAVSAILQSVNFEKASLGLEQGVAAARRIHGRQVDQVNTLYFRHGPTIDVESEHGAGEASEPGEPSPSQS